MTCEASDKVGVERSGRRYAGAVARRVGQVAEHRGPQRAQRIQGMHGILQRPRLALLGSPKF